MRIESRFDYPVSLGVLTNVLTSRDYYETRYQGDDGRPDGQLERWEQTPEGLRIHVVIDIAIKMEKVPRLVRPFVSPSMPLRNAFFWHGFQPGQTPAIRKAECHMSLGKAPLFIEGEMHLTEQNGQAVRIWRLAVVSELPLLGERVLEKARPRIHRVLDDDHRRTLAYLAGLREVESTALG
jgi:hypothetical protein